MYPGVNARVVVQNAHSLPFFQILTRLTCPRRYLCLPQPPRLTEMPRTINNAADTEEHAAAVAPARAIPLEYIGILSPGKIKDHFFRHTTLINVPVTKGSNVRSLESMYV